MTTPTSMGQVLAGCWDRIDVSQVGRKTRCADIVRTIGEFCAVCDAGRLAVIDGEVRCNRCDTAVGRFEGFLEPFSLESASGFLAAESRVVEDFLRCQKSPRRPIPLGRPFWVLGRREGGSVRRIVWEGQPCPSCPAGQLEHFCGPDADDSQEALICLAPGCGYGVLVVGSVLPTERQELRFWWDVPLEASPSSLLQRLHRLSGKPPLQQLTTTARKARETNHEKPKKMSST